MPESPQTFSQSVIKAVANAEGVAPTDLNPPLYDAIDPDALDALLRGATGEVTFDYAGYHVRINHEENVELVPLSGT